MSSTLMEQKKIRAFLGFFLERASDISSEISTVLSSFSSNPTLIDSSAGTEIPGPDIKI